MIGFTKFLVCACSHIIGWETSRLKLSLKLLINYSGLVRKLFTVLAVYEPFYILKPAFFFMKVSF